MIDGVIYDMSAPEVVHQRIAGLCYFRISEYIQKQGGSCIPMMSPVDVRLDCDDKTMVQPDVIILCDDHKIKRWGIMGAPEFVLEVTSASTRKRDFTKKLQKYAEAGVKEYWIIDPKKKSLVTYDFINEDMPCVWPLKGRAGLALYNGELEINLDEIAGLIQEWPE
jgi:Uma2 family endonuclease